jgi:hypothetical protein
MANAASKMGGTPIRLASDWKASKKGAQPANRLPLSVHEPFAHTIRSEILTLGGDHLLVFFLSEIPQDKKKREPLGPVVFVVVAAE